MIEIPLSVEYLGYCKQKGDIYSMQVRPGVYHIVAMQDDKASILIIHEVK